MACSRITKTINEDLLEPYLQEIKEASVVSIFFDGATNRLHCDRSLFEIKIIGWKKISNLLFFKGNLLLLQ